MTEVLTSIYNYMVEKDLPVWTLHKGRGKPTSSTKLSSSMMLSAGYEVEETYAALESEISLWKDRHKSMTLVLQRSVNDSVNRAIFPIDIKVDSSSAIGKVSPYMGNIGEIISKERKLWELEKSVERLKDEVDAAHNSTWKERVASIAGNVVENDPQIINTLMVSLAGILLGKNAASAMVGLHGFDSPTTASQSVSPPDQVQERLNASIEKMLGLMSLSDFESMVNYLENNPAVLPQVKKMIGIA